MVRPIIAKTSVALAALLVLVAPVSRAQDNCQSFRAILPMNFDIAVGWYGPAYTVMGAEVLFGKWSIEVPPQTTCDAVSCQDTGGRSRIDFGGSGLMNPGDTLTIELQTAKYTLPDGFGTYRAMWKITGGTGRFAQASGMAFEMGPFVAWLDEKDIPQGRYVGEVDGSICGVKPQMNPHFRPSAKPVASAPAAASSFYLRQFSPGVRK